MMADDKLLWFLAMEFADNYGQNSFFQDEYDDSLALAMAAVGNNIITFKYVIFIFLTVKNQILRRHLVRTNKNKTSIFRSQRRFFPLSLLTAAKSSLSNWTVNFRLSLTSLSSLLRNWTPSCSVIKLFIFLSDPFWTSLSGRCHSLVCLKNSG